jgi:phosphoribosylanthranilate isomerase
MPFQVKICGVTNVADAVAAVESGADAIGLNFYRGGRRYIDAIVARRIHDAVSGQVECAGVFVNDTVDTIRATCASAGLELVQLHGDEPTLLLKQLYEDARSENLQIIRARRFGSNGVQEIQADLAACRADAGRAPDAILIDAATAGEYGGTGRVADWEQIAGYRQWLGDVPLILAGGLTPENVAEAIRIVRPHAVDVASGVETSPGQKDPAKMRDFVAAARAGLSQ